ncbi:TOBE domain-containing protein [Sulfurovum sp. ST-21]|uniref:TOBE domain-containing protein n=1 Tax=Sulfurovum indicum TaxID=2779528 RepID=A0A7M1S5G7_9BACT|nr:TOBE domain-containing protein [Sulfurovum indicum]QOR62231.1 TOBE domain-containing protein [Sulfurovum indicum]
MSKIIAKVSTIQSIETLNIVSFECRDTILTMVSLELGNEISVGREVLLNVKPTSMAVGKNIQGELSYSNQLNVKIAALSVGELLCSLKLQFHDFVLESIITTAAQKRMNLQVNDEVIALIKSTDLSIEKVLS